MNWSILREALTYYGEKEVAGRRANPRIVKWLRAIFPAAHSDETPWCSAFMFHIAGLCAAERPVENQGLARSWLTVGEHVLPKNAAPGDVVVFKRGTKAWQGHVAIFVRRKGAYIYCLGGNQKNSVNIGAYKESDLIAVRRLRPQGQLTCGE